ncbi:MAG: serine/threonine-protein phosphatase, partial [Oscillospiraceae bacterium]
VIHAGVGMKLNFGWLRKYVIEYMEDLADVGFTAKTLTTILTDHCNELYGGEPGDDTTVCTVKIRKREPMNLLIGPPVDRNDCSKMMSLFFSKEGKHIVCGGSTSTIAAEYLQKPIKPCLDFYDPEIPPTAEIEGVDLVTEGVITINKVLKYAQNYLEDNESYTQWSYKKDGASMIARLLFEEATDINFYVGRAINPAHQNPTLPINFNIKMQLVSELAECLKKMGKKIKVSYF